MQNRKKEKKLPLSPTNVATDLRDSLQEKEEAVATDTRERDSLAKSLADLESAAQEMAQALNRYVETRPNLLREVKALYTRLTPKLEAINKKLKPQERREIRRVVESTEKTLDDQIAELKSSEREAQTASKKYVLTKERADRTDQQRRKAFELLSDKSKELNQARDLQGRIEITEAKNPKLALALLLELERLLSRLTGPSTSTFEKQLNTIWVKWREDREALRQAELTRDAAVAQFEHKKANLEGAFKYKSMSLESALAKRRTTGGFHDFSQSRKK